MMVRKENPEKTGYRPGITVQPGQRILIKYWHKEENGKKILRRKKYKVEKVYPHFVLVSSQGSQGEKIRTCFTVQEIERGMVNDA